VSVAAQTARRRPRVSFDPIQQLRAHEYVAEQIRRHIALRLVAPGESLPSENDRRISAALLRTRRFGEVMGTI